MCSRKEISNGNKFDLSYVFSCLPFLLTPPPTKTLITHYKKKSMPWALAFVNKSTSLCLSHYKTCWTMSGDNISLKTCLLEASNSMGTPIFFFLDACKPKWSRDKFNNQSQIYKALGRIHGP